MPGRLLRVIGDGRVQVGYVRAGTENARFEPRENCLGSLVGYPVIWLEVIETSKSLENFGLHARAPLDETHGFESLSTDVR